VEVRTPTMTLAGIMEDVDGDGALLLRTDEGTLQRFSVGDVSLRICP
jgi:biotin-(acetyl-CoA carboxylase) ligase